MAILFILNKIPPYMYNCKLAMLSKTNSTIVRRIGDIRPIGLLSMLWKVIEKMMKNLMDKGTRLLDAVNLEQAGFTPGRSTLT